MDSRQKHAGMTSALVLLEKNIFQIIKEAHSVTKISLIFNLKN